MKLLFRPSFFNLNLFDWRFVVYMHRPQNFVKIGLSKSTKKTSGVRVCNNIHFDKTGLYGLKFAFAT